MSRSVHLSLDNVEVEEKVLLIFTVVQRTAIFGLLFPLLKISLGMVSLLLLNI